MTDKQFRCRGCGKLHRARIESQSYCGKAACQRKRRNRWRRERYATDADYRQTTRDSTQSWFSAQGGAAQYYRDYRRKKKAQTPQPPVVTPITAAEAPDDIPIATQPRSANSDASSPKTVVMSGDYWLVPKSADLRANSDAILVQLTKIADESVGLQRTTLFPSPA